MAKSQIQRNIQDVEVSFHIFIENRKSIRVSFGKKGVYVRIPSFLSPTSQQEQIVKAIDWVEQKSKSKPALLDQYRVKDYEKINVIFIYDKEINVQIIFSDRKSGKGSYDRPSNTIIVVLPNSIESSAQNNMIKTLLSRICGQLFLTDITRRVHEINDKCFQKEIKSVNLKYNKSNWGSCSSKSNLNFSTRLLFAPKDVIDYVIVHELAHLIEMNHSPKFWNIVHQVMPTYKEKEKWLSKNGHLCDF